MSKTQKNSAFVPGKMIAVLRLYSGETVLCGFDETKTVDEAVRFLRKAFSKGITPAGRTEAVVPEKIYLESGGKVVFEEENPMLRSAELTASKSMILDKDVECRVCGEPNSPYEDECRLCGTNNPIGTVTAKFPLCDGGTAIVSLRPESTLNGYIVETFHIQNAGGRERPLGRIAPQGVPEAIRRFNNAVRACRDISITVPNPSETYFLPGTLSVDPPKDAGK